MAETQFPRGALIEVCCDDDGFRGAWFEATVLRSVTRRQNKPQLYIEYSHLVQEQDQSKPLKEFVNVVNARPRPPRDIDPTFKLSEEVDAFHNDAWWEGIVTQVLDNSRYSVFFRGTKEQIEFGKNDLRRHREWIDGSWNPPKEVQLDLDSTPSNSDDKYDKGTLVEVSSNEEGFQGVWFTATIVKASGKNKYTVEYQTLITDKGKPLREVADTAHIRPLPPETKVDSFGRLEEVDALYKDGWWVGVISKVTSRSKYIVYFRNTNEELEFKHSDLRVHYDWIDGKWVRASKALGF